MTPELEPEYPVALKWVPPEYKLKSFPLQQAARSNNSLCVNKLSASYYLMKRRKKTKTKSAHKPPGRYT
jgi:hypothetical protein